MSEPILGFEGEFRFLSNYYPGTPVMFDGVAYVTAEHAYQAAKSLDPEVREKIRNLTTPGAAKRAGKKLSLRADWDEVKDDVMYRVVFDKFSSPAQKVLRTRLLETGVRRLVETNTWHDQYWGNCICGRPQCEREGRNQLGLTLMLVRQELREGKTVVEPLHWGDPMIGVIGSRSFKDPEFLEKYLDQVRTKYPKMWLVSGAQPKGADGMAEWWAKKRGVPCLLFPPDWNGPALKGAGFARNTFIVNYSKIIIAFWIKGSNGTGDSLEKAFAAGKKVVISFNGKTPVLVNSMEEAEALSRG